jgi:hypothetical protein
MMSIYGDPPNTMGSIQGGLNGTSSCYPSLPYYGQYWPHVVYTSAAVYIDYDLLADKIVERMKAKRAKRKPVDGD